MMKPEELEAKLELSGSGGALDVAMSDSKPALERDDGKVYDDDEKMEMKSETSDSDDEPDEPPIENPSMDIRGDLEQSLEGDLADSFKGSPSFARTYSDAPNPGLNLQSNGIGRIGLPLNEREAKSVISGCIQAPFGKGERTIVDTSVRDTWEMDASMVVFENPAWPAYIHRVMEDVCTALGVDMATSQPRCELYKLLLYETGSHFLPHVDTEKADGMFATLVVVLPSAFTGGAAYLAHGSHSAVYDTAATSALSTTALAWYTDVMHEIKPITSGYRLALAYNLVHTTTALRPSLGGREEALQPLRHVLRSWKQRQHEEGSDERSEVPRRIVYLLEHQYSQAGLRGSALKGIDAHTLAALDVVAKELGFRLGLASLECHLSGCADDDYGYSERRGGWGYDSEEDDDEDYHADVGFGEISETDVSITHLVDLHGNKLQEMMDFDEEIDSTIPETLVEDVQDGNYDDQEYEGYMGNGAGSLDRWYRRTVLVIWPGGFNLDMTFEDDIQDAMTRLADAGKRPHKRERRLVEFLFDVVKGRGARDDVGQALCDAACVWVDRALWTRALGACKAKGVRSLGNELVFKSVDTFGFEFVRPSLEHMLNNETSNHHRFQFLVDIELWLGAKEGNGDDVILAWVTAQRQLVFNNLKKPAKEDGQILLDTARHYGGLPLLRDLFVPQLKRIAGSAFLLGFAALITAEQAKPDVSAQDQEILRGVVTDLLSSSIAKVDFYAATKPIQAATGYSYGRPHATKEADPRNAMAYFKLCLATNNEPLVGRIVARLTNMTGIAPADVQVRAKKVLLPLLPLVHQDVKSRSPEAPPVPGIHDLHQFAVKLYLDTMSANTPATRDELKLLIQSAILHGGTGLLSNTIWPTLKSKPYQERVMIDFIQELRFHGAQIPIGENGRPVDSLITEVLQLVIQKASYTGYAAYAAHAPRTYYYASGGASGSANRTKTIELLGLCVDTGNIALCGLVFARLLAQPLLKPNYVEHVLVPFIPELRAFLRTRKIAPHADPFGAVFTSIVSLWAKLVLGPKPDDTAAQARLSSLGRATCKCAQCVEVLNFLRTGAEVTKSLHRIGAPKRKHLERELAAYASRACTWKMIAGSPQGLEVTKHKEVVAPARWRAAQIQGPGILKSVSADQDELQKIFGADYQRVMDMLAGRPPSKSAPVTAPQTATQASISQAALPAGHHPSSSSACASTSTTRKRKQADYNANDIIDLT